jgi:putative proteasome-type protease
MTYCVGMQLDAGLIFMSDTRTNAGVDNISVFRKMFSWEADGERVITMLTAGNLATTQSVISQLEERSKAPQERRPSILEAPSMFQVANIVGETLRDTIRNGALGGSQAESLFDATIILGGQIKGSQPGCSSSIPKVISLRPLPTRLFSRAVKPNMADPSWFVPMTPLCRSRKPQSC